MKAEAWSFRQGVCPKLEQLDLNWCTSDDGLQALAEAWHHGAPCAQTLQGVDLGAYHNMGTESLKAVADVLQANALPSLVSLTLGKRIIEGDEAVAIIEALRADTGVGSHLEMMMFVGKCISKTALQALVEGLENGMMPSLFLLVVPPPPRPGISQRETLKETIKEALEASGRREGNGEIIVHVGTFPQSPYDDDDDDDDDDEDAKDVDEEEEEEDDGEDD